MIPPQSPSGTKLTRTELSSHTVGSPSVQPLARLRVKSATSYTPLPLCPARPLRRVHPVIPMQPPDHSYPDRSRPGLDPLHPSPHLHPPPHPNAVNVPSFDRMNYLLQRVNSTIQEAGIAKNMAISSESSLARTINLSEGKWDEISRQISGYNGLVARLEKRLAGLEQEVSNVKKEKQGRAIIGEADVKKWIAEALAEREVPERTNSRGGRKALADLKRTVSDHDLSRLDAQYAIHKRIDVLEYEMGYGPLMATSGRHSARLPSRYDLHQAQKGAIPGRPTARSQVFQTLRKGSSLSEGSSPATAGSGTAGVSPLDALMSRISGMTAQGSARDITADNNVVRKEETRSRKADENVYDGASSESFAEETAVRAETPPLIDMSDEEQPKDTDITSPGKIARRGSSTYALHSPLPSIIEADEISASSSAHVGLQARESPTGNGGETAQQTPLPHSTSPAPKKPLRWRPAEYALDRNVSEAVWAEGDEEDARSIFSEETYQSYQFEATGRSRLGESYSAENADARDSPYSPVIQTPRTHPRWSIPAGGVAPRSTRAERGHFDVPQREADTGEGEPAPEGTGEESNDAEAGHIAPYQYRKRQESGSSSSSSSDSFKALVNRFHTLHSTTRQPEDVERVRSASHDDLNDSPSPFWDRPNTSYHRVSASPIDELPHLSFDDDGVPGYFDQTHATRSAVDFEAAFGVGSASDSEPGRDRIPGEEGCSLHATSLGCEVRPVEVMGGRLMGSSPAVMTVRQTGVYEESLIKSPFC